MISINFSWRRIVPPKSYIDQKQSPFFFFKRKNIIHYLLYVLWNGKFYLISKMLWMKNKTETKNGTWNQEDTLIVYNIVLFFFFVCRLKKK